MGQINLFKMIFLPKFLYTLSNSPVYVSKQIFRSIDSNVVGFLLGSRSLRASMAILKLSVTMGGLALPDLWSYFLAAQLSFLHWRFFPQIPNATTLLESVVATSQGTLLNMVYRKGVPGRMVGSVLALPSWIFHLCAQQMRDGSLWKSPNSPLWYNRALTEFSKMEDRFV